jgi:CheY-like chemotaxis protein
VPSSAPVPAAVTGVTPDAPSAVHAARVEARRRGRRDERAGVAAILRERCSVDTYTRRPVVLIADPLPAVRELLKDAFRDELGAFVAAVGSGEELLRQLDELLPSLVVVEVARGEQGLDVLRRIGAHPNGRDLPVLAVVPGTGELSCESARAAGCRDCLEKPFDVGELLARAGTLLGVAPISDAFARWRQSAPAAPRPAPERLRGRPRR